MATPTRKREEGGYIPPGDASTMAALERWQALPPEQRAERRDEGLALRDAYMEGFGTPPPEDVAFTRPNGSQWAVEQPEDAAPASMADLRRMDDAGPEVETPTAGGETPGKRVIRLPEMHIPMGEEARQDWQDAGAARPALPATKPQNIPRRPMVDVSQAGQAAPGGLFERLAAAGRAPLQPTPAGGISPEVRAFVEKRAAPMDGLQQAQNEERNRRLAEAIYRTGAGINTALTGAKAPEGVDFDVEGPKREFAERQAEDARKTEVARQSALRDPNSPESIRQRAALKAVLPNVPDEVLAGVTAENAGSLFDRLKFGASEATRRAEAEKEAARYGAEQEYRKGRDTVEDSFKRSQMAASADERRLRREALEEQRAYTRSRAEDSADARAGQQRLTAEGVMRREVSGNPTVKEYEGAELAYGKITDALGKGTAAGDMAGIFAFMKALDSGSTVREGEYASAKNATGVPERIRNAYNQALDGQLLSPAQRGEFISTARGQVDVAAKRADAIMARYEDVARKSGLSAESVVPTGMRPDLGLTQPPANATAAPSAQPKQLADVPLLALNPGQKLSDAVQEGQVYRVRTKNGVRLMAKRGGELVYED